MAIKTTGQFTKNMKNTYKAVLAAAAALGLASAMSLKASSGYDLIAGFTTGSGSDVMLDIGPVTAYPGATGLSNGETWNLGATNAFTSESFNFSGSSWGIIGDADSANDGASPQTLWVTTSGSTPPSLLNNNQFGQADTGISEIEDNVFGNNSQGNYESSQGQIVTVAFGNANSWNTETLSGTLDNDFINAYANPNASGAATATLWQVPTGGTPTALGKFTLNSSGLLTFSTNLVSSAPAPQIQYKLTTRNSNTTTVYFTTVSGHIYTLYYTNSTGLLAPVSKWPTNTTTISGNGSVESLTDTTATPNRFYTVGVH